MNNVFQFFPTNKFTLESARHLLPTLINITKKHSDISNKLLNKLQTSPETEWPSIEKALLDNTDKWKAKLNKLGIEAKGMWLADFDCGIGYYCWKFPETTLEHFHAYNEGVQNRIKISS